MVQCRLFRNSPAVRWEYRVHEQIQPAVERWGGTVRPTEIFIEHSGYEEAAVYVRKLKRNISLLFLEDQERPNDPFHAHEPRLGIQESGTDRRRGGLLPPGGLASCKPGMLVAQAVPPAGASSPYAQAAAGSAARRAGKGSPITLTTWNCRSCTRCS